MRRIILLILVLPILSLALEIEPDAAFVRVIDSGAGLATVVRLPGDHYIIYDAGHWNDEGGRTFDAFAEVIRHRIFDTQAAEPAIRQVQPHFLAQLTFRADTQAVTDQQHADHQLRIH